MGLDEEFVRALDLVKKTKFTRKTGEYVPFFKTVIPWRIDVHARAVERTYPP